MAEPTERIAILLELQQQEFEKRAKSAGATIHRLERKFNPLAAAEAKLTKEQLRFNAALEAGTIDAKKHVLGMDLLQREYDQTVAKVNGARSSVVAMNSSVAAQTGFMTRNRHVFQQAGYQVGDFAVQVQGGQSALVAFSQQGSQMLGVFGPWGAVMGAALAVGSSLAGVLLNLGDSTEDTKKKAKTFTDRVEEADAALSAMSSSASAASVGGMEALRKKYGELTAEVQDMALALFEIDKREALEKVGGIVSEVTAEIAKASAASAGTVSAALAAAGTEAAKVEAEAYRTEIESMQANIQQRRGVGFFVDQSEVNLLEQMREELAALEGNFAAIGSLVDEVTISPDLLNDISTAQAGLEAAREAGNFEDMANQLGLIRDLLIEAGDTVTQDVVDGVTNAEALARGLAERLQEGEDAANGIAESDMGGTISGAAGEAARLAKNLGISLETARRLANLGPQGVPAKQVGRGGDPRPQGGSFDDWENKEAIVFNENWEAPQKTKKSGSGRKKKNTLLFDIANKELTGLQRQIEMIGKSKSEIAALTVKHKLLDEAKKRGMPITAELNKRIEAEASEVGALAEKYDQARDKVAAMEQIQGQFKDNVIDAAMGGVDAMDAFKDSIKRAALEYALFGTGSFASIFSGGISTKSSGGGFAGILGSLIPGFANGTNNAPGGLAVINERGGELVNLPNGSQVIPNDLSKRMIDKSSAGGGANGTIRIVVEEAPGFVGRVRAEAQGVAVEVVNAAANDIISNSVDAVDSRMKQTSTFGNN